MCDRVWIDSVRNARHYCCQFVADTGVIQDAKTAADLSLESVVEVTGTVQMRPPGQANKVRYCCV